MLAKDDQGSKNPVNFTSHTSLILIIIIFWSTDSSDVNARLTPLEEPIHKHFIVHVATED